MNYFKNFPSGSFGCLDQQRDSSELYILFDYFSKPYFSKLRLICYNQCLFLMGATLAVSTLIDLYVVS